MLARSSFSAKVRQAAIEAGKLLAELAKAGEFLAQLLRGVILSAGFPKADLVSQRGMAIPMVKTRSEFFIPSRFGEDVTVETTIARFGRSSFDVHHRMLKGGELAVECFETRVWTNIGMPGLRTLRAETIPEDVRAALSR